MHLSRVSATSPEAQELIALLDQDLLRRYDASEIHGIDAEAFDRDGGYLVVCRLEGRAVGCGAFRPLGEGIAEIKRMYVRDEARRKGVAEAILAHLEAELRRRGFESMVLETGTRQQEAQRLYRKLGFFPIPRFEAYTTCDISRCFAKKL
jgi:GNAT superfamily N-acetyltransferase